MTSPATPLSILLLTDHYPTPERPHVGTFVQALARTWAGCGVRVHVVAPHPIWSPATRRVVWRQPDEVGEGQPQVMRPSFLSLSNYTLTPRWSTRRLGVRTFRAAALRRARALRGRVDVVYAHFLFPAGAAARAVADALGVPAVAALGESGFGNYEREIGRDRVEAALARLDGALAVSRENRDYAVAAGMEADRIETIPNAVDVARFRPGDKAALRARLGLPPDALIALQLGSWTERKGPLRTLAAVEQHPSLSAVFLGSGPQVPRSDAVLFAGRVPHDDVPDWLAAADCFVLPTLAEGSPNAVLEAMACGLPIISSDIPALREVLSPEEALLVDPRDTTALAAALARMVGDAALRGRLAAAARRRAESFTLPQRARRIEAWLATRICGQRRAAGQAG